MASDQKTVEGPPNLRHATDIASGPQHGQQHLPSWTEEERIVMKECDRDSFFQRALPLSLGCMLGAHMLVRSGRWSPNPKYGSLPKVIACAGVGYFIGKISYLPLCQKKILEKIPNSNLAAAIRKNKGLPEHDVPPATWGNASANDPISSRTKEDYSAPEGLDDRFRPTMDRDVKEPEATPQDKGSLSYEELRRRNRKDYEDHKEPPKIPGAPSVKSSSPLSPLPDSHPGDTDTGSEQPPPPPPSETPSRKRRTNIWGDPIEE